MAIEEGRIACVRRPVDPRILAFGSDDEVVLELQGGLIGPDLATCESLLGLVEIRLEPLRWECTRPTHWRESTFDTCERW